VVRQWLFFGACKLLLPQNRHWREFSVVVVGNVPGNVPRVRQAGEVFLGKSCALSMFLVCQCSWCVNVLGVSMFLVLCFVVHVVEKHTGIQWVEVVFLCVFKKIKILFFFKTFIHFVFPTPLPNSISTVICCADGRCPIFKTSLPSTPCCKTRAVP
jgi:hypothetical protein